MVWKCPKIVMIQTSKPRRSDLNIRNILYVALSGLWDFSGMIFSEGLHPRLTYFAPLELGILSIH